MQIQLCKKSLTQIGDGAALLRTEIDRREHFLVEKDCLNRCQGCQLGLLIAVVDGAPMSARTVEKFLADLDEVAE
jgi:hypothetical protein